TVTPAGGAPTRLAIYTALSGKDAGVVLFGATEALFHKHLPEVERLVDGLRFKGAPEPVGVHGLVIPFPPGWTRQDDPKGAVAFTPPAPRGPLDTVWDYTVFVLPSQPLRGTHWQTHKAVFAETMKLLKDPVDAIHRADAPGPFIRSETAAKDADGRLIVLTLYSARSASAIECVLVRGQEDRDGLRAILARTTVKSPPKVERPRIVEAYRRGEQKMYVNPAGGRMTAGSLQYERLWLRSDGVADFTTVYPAGHAASPEILKYDPGQLDGQIGAWKERGDGTIELVRTAGAPAQVGAREGGRLNLGGQVWQRMPAVDGLRLEGRWGVNEVALAFTKDGRFQDDGMMASTALGDTRPGRPPKRGAGTYEIREWTLFVRYDDGAEWSCDFSTIGPDPADLSAILLGTAVFPRK
ncbi:MAG TPA: hypothetical protein VEJ18_11465, partial [Planctomycetota bacterium]|nr:hypothetical protein [Planctomycetota bacterium]